MNNMPLFPGKRLVVFDIDGTLIHAHDIHVKIYQKSLKETAKLIVPDNEHEEISRHFGKPEDEVFKGILEHYHQPHTVELLSQLVESNIQNMKNAKGLITPKNILPGVIKLVESLRREGYIIAVISGNPRPKGEALLRYTGLKPRVDVTAFFNDKIGNKAVRARAEIVELAIKKSSKKAHQSFSPDQVVVIGDTPSDIVAGKTVGTYTVGVATGNYSLEKLNEHHPDKTVRTLEELLSK